MTQEKFKQFIEWPVRAGEILGHWERIKIKSVIARTMRLTLQFPDLAKEYYDSLPKAVCENTSTESNEQNT